MSDAIQEASHTLVDRARQGDQNAMGMIAAIRNNSGRGNPKAKLAAQHMHAYIQSNPVKRRTNFGKERRATFGALQRVKAVKGKGYGRQVVKFVLEMGENVQDSKLAAHVLATGRPIDLVAIRDILAAIPPDIRGVLRVSYYNPHHAHRMCKGLEPAELKVLQLGYILGMCHRIQEVCKPETPLAPFSPMVAWELGEQA